MFACLNVLKKSTFFMGFTYFFHTTVDRQLFTEIAPGIEN